MLSIILYIPYNSYFVYTYSMDNDKRPLIFNGFGLLASVFILLSGQVFAQTMVDLLVQVFGILLIIWAVITIKVNKNKQTDKLPKGYFFITSGPYEIIRHPVYAGYLLVMVGIVEIEFTFLRLVALLILCACIFFKIVREEHTLTSDIPEYTGYKVKTKALIPYLF